MTKEEKIEFVMKIMEKFVENQELKLARGARLREEIRQTIQKGQMPKGYRAEWLINSGHEILAALSKIAKKFDRDFPDDRASVNDLMDILTTAQFLLKKQLKSNPQLANPANNDDENEGD
ncbi:MAG: hypothetical protein EB120_14875 [Proteobacteria bacterium]|nr:hypothetical protein [Pseudomonadota bacterium]